MKANTPSRWLMRQKSIAQGWIRLSIALGVVSALLLILQLRDVARIIDAVFLHGASLAMILPTLWAIMALLMGRALLAWLKEISGFQAAAKIRQHLRMQIMAQLKALGPILSQQKRGGEWVSSALEQVEAVQGFFAQYLPQMTLCVIVPLLIMSVVFSLNWLAGLVLLITAPLIPLFMALVGMGAASINQKNFQALSRMSAHFLDVLQGLNTLKLFDRSRAETAKIYQVSEDYRKTTMQTLRVAFLSSGVLEFFSACAVALLATYLGLSLLHGIHIGQPLDLYSALFILLLAPEFFLPLRELSTHYHARAAAVGAAEEIMGILALAPPQPFSPAIEKALPTDWPCPIELNHISFAYSKTSAPIWVDYSLKINAGEHLAIIGPSGRGKSTLLHLLLGFITPTAGSILIGGTPLSAQNLKEWQSKIGWLSQQPTLFPGTIRENLLMAQPQADEAALWRVLAQAAMEDCVKTFPLGLDTLIAEQNLGLSGGQAQRIALARLYLKDPPILLLDEPTANLDPLNQELVMTSLREQSQGKTLILLTHRLETLLPTDRVIEL